MALAQWDLRAREQHQPVSYKIGLTQYLNIQAVAAGVYYILRLTGKYDLYRQTLVHFCCMQSYTNRLCWGTDALAKIV